MTLRHISFLLACLTLLSCQKIDLGQDEDVSGDDLVEDGKVRVNFQITSIEQIPFENTTSQSKENATSQATSNMKCIASSKASGSTSLSTLCSRFTVAVFQDSTKEKAVNQTSDNSGFTVVTAPISTPTTTFEIYTFPHEATDFLNIKITALDTLGTTVAEKTLSNIYIHPNVITQHTCRFFNDSTQTASTQTATTFTPENNGQWYNVISQ